MWTLFLWFILVWILIGLLCSGVVILAMRWAEKSINDGDNTCLSALSLLYSMLDTLPPGSLQVACIVAWPYLVYRVSISLFTK